jgi:hypothetical protein
MTARQVGPESPPPNRGRLQSLAPIVLFDVVGPLAVYYSLRSAGLSTVPALLLTGVLPAFGVALSVVRHRRLDVVGVLVLAGIVVRTVLGIATGSAHLVLLEGTVGTAVFGAVCVGSLWSKRPLIFRFALEFMGADTPKGGISPTAGAIPVSATPSGSLRWSGVWLSSPRPPRRPRSSSQRRPAPPRPRPP